MARTQNGETRVSVGRRSTPINVRPCSPAKTAASAGTRKTSVQAVNPLTLKSGGSIGYERAPPKLFVGYMGPTGHSAILLDNTVSLGADVLLDGPKDTGPEPEQKTLKRRAFCMAILGWLPSRHVCEQFMDHFYRVSCTVTPPREVMRHFHLQFWATYEEFFKEPRKPEKVALVVDELCHNTSIPLPIPATNRQWLQSFTGSKSRWDMVGLVFVITGFGVMLRPDNDQLVRDLLPPNADKRSYAFSMLECADACLILCDELDVPSNVLVLALSYKCVLLQSVVEGDTSYSLWKRLGSLVNAVTAFGLHRDLSATEPISHLYIEHSKRLFASTFSTDKVLATFLGRPPAMSRHYVSAQLPLDISEEDVMADNHSRLREELDENGWNTMGMIFPATISRAFMLSSIIRDEILELSLGRSILDISLRVRDVRQRLETSYAQLPLSLHESIEKPIFATRRSMEVLVIAHVQLAWLHHSFLLERIDCPERNEQRHLDAAKKMLTIVVTIWNERDRYVDHKDEVHWLISCYGIPSASALSIDLWKRSTSPQSYPLLTGRSDIIQDLSLFVACLDWITPVDGNFVLCGRVRKMIKYILDRVLAPDFIPAEAPSQVVSGFDLADISLADIPLFGTDLGNWFDAADWTSAPWIDEGLRI